MKTIKNYTFSSLEESILTTLACSNALKIYPTSFELFSLLLKPKLSRNCAVRSVSYSDVMGTLEQLEALDLIHVDRGFYFFSFLRPRTRSFSTYRIQTDKLLDQKWNTLARYLSWFRFLPFLEGVFVSGSLTIGTVQEDSDFDFLLVSTPDHLYTLRLFSVCVFNLLGIRRKPHHKGKTARNKVCLNHYLSLGELTMKNRLFEGMLLDTHLVPVYVRNTNLISEFFKANEWIREYFFRTAFQERVQYSERPHIPYRFSLVREGFEWFLDGRMGKIFEHAVYTWQKRRIPEGQNCFATPHELNLHPHLEERYHRLDRILHEYFRRLW
ncbi:MAG: hypothetical protein KGI50_04705 [Patescibacteria group bacterium]|nr:hypothetical protein [Patescibacteria group bacterium]MDE2438662.1 hypothetical protein [Patescibacteria group bacterium]